jgi:sugar O-acyltransferase (sialic acid O-acetyltransferase NeuD family)
MSDMDEGVLVIGTGGHARFVLATLEKAQQPVKGLITLDDSYSSEELILSKRIIGTMGDLPSFFSKGDKSLLLAVGDNEVRKEIYHVWAEFGFLFHTVVHPDAFVDPSVSVGAANIVGPKVVIGASVIIGENNIINSSCVVEHESVIGSHCHIAPGAVICGRVVLGDEVMVGASGTIIDYLTVANKTLLGAGATLIHSVSIEGQTLVGSPARRIPV